MSESLFSPVWHRVSDLHPRLGPGVRVQRQNYRGETWYLLVDPASSRQHRINRAAYEFIGRFDGRSSVNELWTLLLEKLGDHAPSQADVVATLVRLAEAELVQLDNSSDIGELFRRRATRAQSRRPWVNPLAFSLPLFDPSRLLDRIEPVLRPILQPFALIVWAALLFLGAAAAAVHWNELHAYIAKHLSTPYFLTLAWICFPVIKALHELGHAIAVRRGQGEVHEVGVTFFFFTPAPYVDASAANAFRSRWQRAAVSAAGIMIELAIGAAALLVWLAVEPGLVRDAALVTVVICAVSSLVFNGNPLLRFDGYHVFCELLDLPNLAVRSRAYWVHLLRRVAIGATDAVAPPVAHGERKWLLAYAPASWLYRIVLAGAIVLWAASKWAMLGWLAALLAVVFLVIRPAILLGRDLLGSLPPSNARRRAAYAIAMILAAAALTAIAVPLPNTVIVQGIVWPGEHARVRAESAGFVVDVRAYDGQQVRADEPLVLLAEPALFAERETLQSRVWGLQARQYHAITRDPLHARNVVEEIQQTALELKRVEERIEYLTVRSKANGRLALPKAQDLPGQFIAQGTTLGYVMTDSSTVVRAAVPHQEASVIRSRTRAVEVMLAERRQPLRAQIARETPAATHLLPSSALSERSGGRHVTDPADKDHLQALEPVLVFDIALEERTVDRLGGRAWVRFDLGAEPLAAQSLRRLQQLLLKHFNPAS